MDPSKTVSNPSTQNKVRNL